MRRSRRRRRWSRSSRARGRVSSRSASCVFWTARTSRCSTTAWRRTRTTSAGSSCTSAGSSPCLLQVVLDLGDRSGVCVGGVLAGMPSSLPLAQQVPQLVELLLQPCAAFRRVGLAAPIQLVLFLDERLDLLVDVRVVSHPRTLLRDGAR